MKMRARSLRQAIAAFGMDTITLAGSLEAKLDAMREAGFSQVMLKANDLAGYPGGWQAAVRAVEYDELRLFLGDVPEGRSGPPLVTFAVGGAGAQASMVELFLPPEAKKAAHIPEKPKTDLGMPETKAAPAALVPEDRPAGVRDSAARHRRGGCLPPDTPAQPESWSMR